MLSTVIRTEWYLVKDEQNRGFRHWQAYGQFTLEDIGEYKNILSNSDEITGFPFEKKRGGDNIRFLHQIIYKINIKELKTKESNFTTISRSYKKMTLRPQGSKRSLK